MSHRQRSRCTQKTHQSTPNFMTATRNYNRAAFTHLLDITRSKVNPDQDALRSIIMDTFGVTKAHAGHLITAAHVLRRYPTVCSAITKNGTIDIARLVIVGKQLSGLTTAQLKQLKPRLHALCSEADWVSTSALRTALVQARLEVDEVAREKAAAQAEKRAKAQANKTKPAVLAELPDGCAEITLRVSNEHAPDFRQQITAAVHRAKQPV